MRSARLLPLLVALLAPPVLADEPILPIPRSIPYDHAKAELGKRLFFDPRLSSDGKVACVSCHNPSHGGAEPRAHSLGVYRRAGTINAPTVYNAYFNFRQFWNGRAKDLQEQAGGPIHNPVEMDLSAAEVARRLEQDDDYRARFTAVYGDGPITFDHAADAIAEFEKALTTPNAKFDRWLRGEGKLTTEEAAGYLLFKSLGCVSCHNGINVGGNSYQYLGAVNPVTDVAAGGDLYARTGDEFDRNRYKVPSLRNIELTAPYLHDGSRATLEEALATMAYHNLGFTLSRQETRRLSAFLHTLTGDTPAILGAEQAP
ncbi:cytochrome-c peroxidase [Endothiovibrio diazotrophicus]